MLVLTRKPRQQIMIGDEIKINIVEVQGDSVRLAIDAPRTVRIYRGEIYKAIQEENQSAAKNSEFQFDMLKDLPKSIQTSSSQSNQANNQLSIQTSIQISQD